MSSNTVSEIHGWVWSRHKSPFPTPSVKYQQRDFFMNLAHWFLLCSPLCFSFLPQVRHVFVQHFLHRVFGHVFHKVLNVRFPSGLQFIYQRLSKDLLRYDSWNGWKQHSTLGQHKGRTAGLPIPLNLQTVTPHTGLTVWGTELSRLGFHNENDDTLTSFPEQR